MTKEEKTEIFNDYRYLIQKISHSFYVTNPGIDYGELLSEGYISFLNCIDDYDSEEYRISTFIKNCVKNHLINYCKDYYHKNQNIYSDKLDKFITNQQDEKTKNYYLDIFEDSGNTILQSIVKVIKQSSTEKSKHHRKYGWLDKKVYEITGEKYTVIWNEFKTAEAIIKG